MCGRFVLDEKKPKEIQTRFETENNIELFRNYNIAPSFNTPVITRNSPNKIEFMKWGLIPFWAKDPKIGFKMINARAETITSSPAFRMPIKKQRCLVVARGFYEWNKIDTKNKTPYYFHMKNDSLFAFAGLYDIWKDAEGYETKSYTIITCKPNKVVSEIHDRMPVILSKETENIWIDTGSPMELVLEQLKPYAGDKLEKYQVSTEVNSPKNNNSELIIEHSG